MPSESPWKVKISNANKYYDTWMNKFKCEVNEKYYEGFQWQNLGGDSQYRPYTLNLVMSTIQIKLASTIFQNPQTLITPMPGNANWNYTEAIESAQLKQDLANTIINIPNAHFVDVSELVALETFFRFGMAEVGYAADWRNPVKKPPVTESHYDNETTKDLKSQRVVEDLEIPSSELIYFKHIPARRFRVSTSDNPFLSNCSWCGYYSFMYRRTLVKTKGLSLPKEAVDILYSSDYESEVALLDGEKDRYLDQRSRGQTLKMWNIWDNETNERLLFVDGYFDEPVWQTKYERLPFSESRGPIRTEGWYPVPPVFNWLSPQDEVNQAREQMRNYRKRYTRKFQVIKGRVDQAEIEKFSTESDGLLITVKERDAISPIQNPEIGVTIENPFQHAKDDFDSVSATSAAARQEEPDESATASKIKEARAQIRESAEQIKFSKFLESMIREAILQAQENLALGLWVRFTQDPMDELFGEVQVVPSYRYVTSEQMEDGYDFKIEVDIVNAPPIRQQEELNKLITFISIINQFPMIAMSPPLIMEVAYKAGYRNLKVIRQVQQMAILSQIGMIQGNNPNAGSNANNIAQQQIANAAPNTSQEINNQLQSEGI